jgi:hypothetical protein
MTFTKKTIASIFICLTSYFATGQEVEKPPVDGKIFAFHFILGGDTPGGDLKTRYGANLNFGLAASYISKSDWFITPEFRYLYGDVIKEDILAPYRTKEGILLGDNDAFADIRFSERGIFIGATVGKILRVSNMHRSGFSIGIGGGLLAHQILFRDNDNSFGQIRAGRSVGYDRLTRGPALKQSIGYKLFSQDRKLNLEFGFDFLQGFTSEVRGFNYDTGLPSQTSRLDLLYGAKIIWTIPFYKGGEDAVIYY